MHKKYLFIALVVVFAAATIVVVSPVFAGESESESSQVSDNQLIIESDSSITAFKWYGMTEALNYQATAKKKVFIDVYTTWCGPCKMLDANTFSDPVIKKLLAEYFVPSKFNAESGDTIVFKGQTYLNKNYTPQPRKSTHDFAIYIASTQQGLGYPTMVFLDEELNMIQPISGYIGPAQLEPILSFFGTNAYKDTTWEIYLSTFKSQISQ